MSQATIQECLAIVGIALIMLSHLGVSTAGVLLIGSLLVGVLARGELPSRAVTASANNPQNPRAAIRRIGELS